MHNYVAFIQSEYENIYKQQQIWKLFDAVDSYSWGTQCPLQDQRGYIWIGNLAGLHRYDGKEFTLYSEKDGLIDNRIRSVCEDQYGRLWIGTLSFGISCFDGNSFTNFDVDDGLINKRVNVVYKDHANHLWIGTECGLSRFDGEHFTSYSIEDGLIDNYIDAIYEDHRQRLWFGTKESGVSCLDKDVFTNYTSEDGLIDNRISSICSDRQDRVWFGTPKGVSCFDERQFTNYTANDGLVSNEVMGICEDHRGNMWFATQGGVSRFDGRQFTNYTTKHGLLDNRVNGVMQDRERLLWFSHPFSGLVCFDPYTLEHLTSEPVTEILTQDLNGGLWFGNENKLCYFADNQLKTKSFDSTIYSILIDSHKRLWVGTAKGIYLFDYTENIWNSAGRHFTTEEGLGGDTILSLIQTKDRTVWAGTAGAGTICRFNNRDSFEAIKSPQRVAYRMFESGDGRIWICSSNRGDGVSCYDGNKFVTYTTEDGLPSNSVYSILEDDDGKMWFGTEQGLCCFDGKNFFQYGKEEGLAGLNHKCSARDASGQLWFGTLRGGIYRTNGKHFQILNTEDGLLSNSITGLLPQADNSMIIGTYNGIIKYNPTTIAAPLIEIREVMADQVYKNPEKLTLTTKDADLVTISFQSISFATRRMLYSYMLEGYDKEWKDTWYNQIRYENLSIREYTFKVIAINKNLICSEKPAILKIEVVPDQWSQLRAEYESEIERMQKLLELNHRVNSQNTLSGTALAIVEGLQELGFDRAGVWIKNTDDNLLYEICGTDESGNVYKNEYKTSHIESIPSDEGYHVKIDGDIIKAKLGIDASEVFLKKDQDEEIFESLWGYLPPCAGYYCRDERGDNICLCVATEDEKIGLVAVDNYVTGRRIDETSANLLSLFGTEISKVLANVALRESLAKYVKNLSFLSKATMGLVEISSEANIYHFIAEKLKEIAPDHVIIALELDKKSNKFFIHSVLGAEEYEESATRILGGELSSIAFSNNDVLSLDLEDIKLKELYSSIYELTSGEISQSVSQEIEKILNIGNIFTIGIASNGEIFGLVAIITPKGSKLENQDVIETFINQSSIAVERRNTEEKIKTSLAEKVVLLKEIHHRVKNNLQIISSLLNLQSGYIKDKDALLVFQESQSRVKSMALVHEKLYQSRDLATIDFAGYIQELAGYLFRTYAAKSGQIEMKVSVDDISVDIDTAIPCGLIVNELVVNSIKHGFPVGSEFGNKIGNIYIEIKSIENNKLTLSVSDNGIGFPEDVDFKNTKSLGLQLVNTLTAQLDGDVELIRENGTTFKITFIASNLKRKGYS